MKKNGINRMTNSHPTRKEILKHIVVCIIFVLTGSPVVSSRIVAQVNWSTVDSVENHFPIPDSLIIPYYLKVNNLSQDELSLKDSLKIKSFLRGSDTTTCSLSLLNNRGFDTEILYLDTDTIVDLSNLSASPESSTIPFLKKAYGENFNFTLLFPNTKQLIMTTIDCDYQHVIISPEVKPLAENSDIFQPEDFAAPFEVLRIYYKNFSE